MNPLVTRVLRSLPWRPLRRVAALAFIALACPQSAGAQGVDPDALLRQMQSDAKDLFASNMPQKEALDEGWRYPWELPPGTGYTSVYASADDYWNNIIQVMGYAGVPESHARDMVNMVSQQAAAAGAAEGITARDGIIMLLGRVRSTDTPTAVKVCDGWEAGARGFSIAEKQLGRPDDATPPDQRQINRTLLDLVSKPWEGKSEDELKDMYVKQATLITKRSQMTYVRCNLWSMLPNVKDDQEAKSVNMKVAVATVNLMFADPNRVENEPLDLDAEACKRLQARLETVVRDACARGISFERAKLYKKMAAAGEDPIAREGLSREQTKLNLAAASLMLMKAVVQKKDGLGDNCYIVKITGVSPDVASVKYGMYVGWIRKGTAMAEVSLQSATYTEAEQNAMMDKFLSELDAKLGGFDSMLSKVLDVGAMPAPALPTTPVSLDDLNKPGGPRPPVDDRRPPIDDRRPPIDDRRPPIDDRRPPVIIPPDDPVEFAQGMAAYNSSNFAEARRLFDEGLRQSPNNPRVLLMRGAANYYLGNLTEALADYKSAAELEPQNAAPRKYWAFMELCAGDARVSAEQAEACLRLNPNDTDALLTRGQAAMSLDQPEQAQQYFQRVLQLQPNRVQTLYQEANTALQQNLFMPAALQFQTVIWLDPNQHGAWYGRGAALTGAGKTKQAIKAYEQYLKYDQTSEYAERARAEIRRLRG